MRSNNNNNNNDNNNNNNKQRRLPCPTCCGDVVPIEFLDV
jgi:hypothetical protein